MSCIKLTGSPVLLSHKMNAYAVASLCNASRAIQSGDVDRWAAMMNDAARFFGTAASCERMEARFGLPADPSDIGDAIDELIAERDEPRARLAEIEAQEPAIVEAGELRIGFGDTGEAVWLKLSRNIPLGTKLYAAPVPAQAVPTGERQAVLLTDDDVWKSDAIMSANEAAGLPMFQLMLLVHAIQAAALAANGLEVRRG